MRKALVAVFIAAAAMGTIASAAAQETVKIGLILAYIRVERAGGELRNVEFDKISDVKDPFKARLKQ